MRERHARCRRIPRKLRKALLAFIRGERLGPGHYRRMSAFCHGDQNIASMGSDVCSALVDDILDAQDTGRYRDLFWPPGDPMSPSYHAPYFGLTD